MSLDSVCKKSPPAIGNIQRQEVLDTHFYLEHPWRFASPEKPRPGCSESIQKGLLSLRSQQAQHLLCHIPSMNTSSTTAFPGASSQVASHITRPHSGWPIHIISVKLVGFSIQSYTGED